MQADEVYRRYVKLLEQCETLPAATLRAQHVKMLDRLCRHARATTAFYRDRLDMLFDAEDQFRFDRWDDAPILTRRDLLERFDDLKSADVPKNFGRVLTATTSGSTGEPVRALRTETQLLASSGGANRFNRWHGLDATESMVLVQSRPEDSGPAESTQAYWSRATKRLGLQGPLTQINGQLPVDTLIARLEAHAPQNLSINPRLLFAIANEYLARGSAPGFALNSIRTFGETRTPMIDARVVAVFGVRPRARYTTEEAGNLAIECPDCDAYHVIEEILRVDVVDAANRRVAPGGSGRVLATPLYSYAMPLIRYEVGDEARLSPRACPRSCATSLAEIEGRLGDLFHHPEGGRFRPNRMVLETVLQHLDAAAAQVVETAPADFVIRYQPRRAPADADQRRAMTAELERSFGFALAVRFEIVEEIPARGRGKREDFTCEPRERG